MALSAPTVLGDILGLERDKVASCNDPRLPFELTACHILV